MSKATEKLMEKWAPMTKHIKSERKKIITSKLRAAHHMIEDLVLDIDLLPLMFNVLKCCLIVLIEETFKFHIFNEAILILIDFFEEF